jgi:hypothetical protein
LSPCTVTTKDCINAIGSELLFMNMAAAIANDLWVRLSPNSRDITPAIVHEVKVTITKMKGIIQSSRNLCGVRKKATLENKSAGVNIDTLIRLSFYCLTSFDISN